MSTFGIPSGALVDRLVLTVTGGAISFALDDIQLQSFAAGSVTYVTVTGLTQADADARYSQRANSLSDLSSASAARANLALSAGSVQVTLGDGVTAITVSEPYQDIVFPFACTLTDVEMLADAAGSLVLAIAKGPYSSFPPAASIVAGAPPTLSSAIKSQDSALTAWTTAVAAGDILRITVTSAAAVKRVVFKVGFTR